MFVGVGAARVRDLFDTARKQHPCIVFIDEIDAIGRKRGAGLGGGQDEREQTLNQILSEMDGFEVTEGIVVLAATNRPDILDPALLRAGRFDRQVVIPLPSQQERTEILAVHAKGKHLAPDVDLDLVARGTPGMSGADLANLVNEAALATVRRGAAIISAADFETARDRLLLGLERSALVVGPEEQRVLAAHEAGHALQHAKGYTPLMLRNTMAPLASFGSWMSYIIILAGFLLGILGLAKIGIVLFTVVVFFQIITLPVEFNASARAKELVMSYNMVSQSEMRGINAVLNAAALTYVAAAASAVMTLLYYVIQLGLLGGRDD